MSVIIGENTYTSGVSNVVDDFIEVSQTANCDGYDLTDFESQYIQIDEFEVRMNYTSNGQNHTATIDFDLDLIVGKGYRVEVTDIIRETALGTSVPITGYVAISKDKSFWVESDAYEFKSNATIGNVFIEDQFTGEETPTLLTAKIKVYKLSQYRVEYTDCDGAKGIIEIENEIEPQTLDYVESPNAGGIFPIDPNYSDKFSTILINPTTSPQCTSSKLVQYTPFETSSYNNGFDFFYSLGNIGFFDIKIEGIGGYCELEVFNGAGVSRGIITSTSPPQNGIERFNATSSPSQNNQYWKIVVNTAGANCDPLTTTPTKLVMDLISQSPQNTDGSVLECCPCNEIDFCGSDFVEIEFTNNCGETIKLAIKGKLQGGLYKIQGDAFSTYAGQRIRPITNIEAQYTLIIFQYSDAFFLALQDIIANNLTIKIGAFEYYFETADIAPTWDNLSEYGFASITLIRKDTIKKIRRNCCS
jgi:hypothetical protein